ncbi:MAG: DUF2085 domain-containing protein [Ignavibacteria bacterium]|nr:DUF2085 domain-containing protein [Ignavibacteria bacterium]
MNFNHTKIYLLISLSLLIFLSFTFAYQFVNNLSVLFFINNFYGQICHQIESRSFFVNAKPLLICARCTGIFLGSFILFVLLSFLKNLRYLINQIDYKKVFIFLLPLFIDWLINFSFKIETTNFVRFLTGILFSFVPVYFLNTLIFNSKS